MAKVKLSETAVKMLLLDVVECSIDPALQEREESFHSVGAGQPTIGFNRE
jgi:hypothetical protein